MQLTQYFIKHPVVALVINTMIFVVGLLSFQSLSIREYPQITFPNATVSVNYPNASAEVIETTVTNVLEDKLAGIEGLDEMTSSTHEGLTRINLQFKPNASIDRAMTAARDAVSLAKSGLPKEVKEPVVERKTTDNSGPPFMAVSIESDTSDFGALTHYAHLNLKNAFRSIPGVSSVEVWGQEYTFEVMLDAKLLYMFGVNAQDVFKVLDEGRSPLPIGKYQDKIPAILVKSAQTKEEFDKLIVKEKSDTFSAVFLGQVATVSLKTDNTSFRVRVNGKPGVVVGIRRGIDANPVDVSALVYKKVDQIKASLPKNIRIAVVLDQAVFVKTSIQTIERSIVEAVLLVLGIVLLFLRSFRATLIPLITIPISLAGAMLFLHTFGYSINIMTLLAMVLAVGLVVDDAIVVLENSARHIEGGAHPMDAACAAAKEIGFAIVAMTATLVSVFAPIAFIQGQIGQLFIEFAVALAGSVLISGVVALTLSPLMCGYLLQTKQHKMFPVVDRMLGRMSDAYTHVLIYVLPKRFITLLFMVLSLGITVCLFSFLPQETVPKEDRSLMGVFVPPIPGKNIDTLDEMVINVEKKIGALPEAESILVFMGKWGAELCFGLYDKALRKRSTTEIENSIQPLVDDMPSVDMDVWTVDSGLPGLDNMDSGKLKMVVSTDAPYRSLFDAGEKILRISRTGKIFPGLWHDLNFNSNAYRVELDNDVIAKFNLDEKAIAKEIEVFFSGDKSLTFNKDGVFYSITLTGQKRPWTLDELYFTTKKDVTLSLGAIGTLTPAAQPADLFHYNQMHALILITKLKDGMSLENGMVTLKQLTNTHLPEGYKQNWIGSAKAHLESQSTMIMLIFLSIVFIYAIMAMQFESFIDPFIVMLTVPLAAMGALLLVWVCGQSMNVYTQVGLITLIGLITKNGILIVEFANQYMEKGETAIDAVKAAAILRLRPILMTTAAMIFGAVPLLLSNASGSESRRIIGAVLVGGLSFGTVLTLIFLPTLYVIIKDRYA